MPAEPVTAAPLSPGSSDLARRLRRLLAWWLSELAQMLPRRLSGFLGVDAEPVVLVTLGPGGAALWPAEAHRPSAETAGPRHNGVTIGLDPSLVFEASLELPQAAEASLRQILEHQIEQLLPLAANQTRFDYRAVRSVDENLIRVRVFIAKCATIEEALAAAREAGLGPSRIILANWREASDPPVLWQADGITDANRALRRRLEIAAIVLVAVGYGLYVHRLDQMRSTLGVEVAAAAAAAAAEGAVARRLSAVDADAAFFTGRRQQLTPLQVIDALSKLVPTDSWLTGLVCNGRTIEISGYSPRASDLVGLVEGSTLFENPRFTSAITLAPDGKREHFSLAFETRRAPAR